MALSENTVLASVQVIYPSDTINVLHQTQIFKDGELLSSVDSAKAYTRDMKDAFLAEVAGAAAYVVILNW